MPAPPQPRRQRQHKPRAAFEMQNLDRLRRNSMVAVREAVQNIELKKLKAHRNIFPRRLAIQPGGHRRERSLAERVHIAFTDRQASVFGKWLSYLLFLLVLVSCGVFVFETTPEAKHFSTECEPCAPLEGAAAGDTDRVEARLELKEFCKAHDCEPRPHAAVYFVQFACTAVFTLVYGVRLATSGAFPLPTERRARRSLVDSRFTLASASSSGRSVWGSGMFAASTRSLLSPRPAAVSLRTRLLRVLAFVARPLNVFDLIANVSDILFVYAFLTNNRAPVRLSVLRAVRLGRVLRIFSARAMVRVSNSFERVMVKSVPALVSLCVLTAFAMVVCGTLVYYAEQGEWDAGTGKFMRKVELGPDEPTPFTSVPQSFWWVLVTFTTVGYGDMYPTSSLGKAVGVLTMYTGVVFMALPIAVVSTKFVEEFLAEQEKRSHKDHVRTLRRKALLTLVHSGSGRLLRRAWNTWVAVVKEAREEENQVSVIVRRTLLEFRGPPEEAPRRSLGRDQLEDLGAEGEGEGGREGGRREEREGDGDEEPRESPSTHNSIASQPQPIPNHRTPATDKEGREEVRALRCDVERLEAAVGQLTTMLAKCTQQLGVLDEVVVELREVRRRVREDEGSL